MAVGCGGGDDDGTAAADEVTTSTLSKAEFVKKANSICVKKSQDLLEEMREFADEPAGASAQEAIQQLWPPALRDEAEEIRSLGAPEGGEAKVEAYLASLEKVTGEIEAKMPKDIFKLQEILMGVNSAAAAYDLESCEF
ncbi:MAG: hypothetical protein ACJ76B_11015 [Solirubrobacterales bacterium]